MMKDCLAMSCIASVFFSPAEAQLSHPEMNSAITIRCDAPRLPVNRGLYGLFFEEINHSGDGGLQAELIRNGGFEDGVVPPRCSIDRNGLLTSPSGWTMNFDRDSIPGWSLRMEPDSKVTWRLDDHETVNSASLRSLRLEIMDPGSQGARIANAGFWGIAIQQGEHYRIAFSAKCSGRQTRNVTISLEAKNGTVYAQRSLVLGNQWKKYIGTIAASESDTGANLVMTIRDKGTVWLDNVTLVPEKTIYGFRPDIMNALADLRPQFFRFPGGCFVEGFSEETMARWKSTVGLPENRTGQVTVWGYRSSNRFGYHEALGLCEEMGMELLFVLNCGMTCQGRNPVFGPMEKMNEFVQDAVDAIEYANGPVTSKWGGLRAKNGHPAPFNLKYIEIGNENWGPEYEQRYPLFYHAIKKAFPGVTIIANSWVSTAPVDMIDEHFYPDPDFFIAHHDHYDHWGLKGTTVYVGEFASTINCGRGNFRAAIGEAAFLTGLERNPQTVRMVSYAPLMGNMNALNWIPNAVFFDNRRWYGTPSYHLLKLFAENRGDEVLSTTVETGSRPYVRKGKIAIVGTNAFSEYKDILVTEPQGKILFSPNFSRGASDWQIDKGSWTFADTLLRSDKRGNEWDQLIYGGDTGWENYTFRCKARIVGGEGGFTLLVRDNGRKGGDQDYCQMVFGGGGNNVLKAEHIVGWARENIGAEVPFSAVPNRWHDIVIELDGSRIRCQVDGEKKLDVNMRDLPNVTAVATYDKKERETILKVVNTSEWAQTVNITFEGAPPLRTEGEEIFLQSVSMEDENSLTNPGKVIPRSRKISGLGNHCTHVFTAHSIAVLRMHEQ